MTAIMTQEKLAHKSTSNSPPWQDLPVTKPEFRPVPERALDARRLLVTSAWNCD